jgi:hypothetical protein
LLALASVLGVGEGHLLHRETRWVGSRYFAKSESLFQSFLRSQPNWEGWDGWGAGRQLKCAALQHAGWFYDESHLPYEQAAQAYEKVRQVLLSPGCRSAEDLLKLLR